MRTPFIAGNWKMNLSLDEAAALAAALKGTLDETEGVDLAVFPPFVFIPAVARVLEGSRVAVGAQNLHPEPSGAFTGEVAASMLRDVGCARVLVGHSERRHLFGETDAEVNAKVQAALRAGLEPICCVGELLEERDAGRTAEVVQRQVKTALEGLDAPAMRRVTIAYEPVWAIGTGRTAARDQAQEVHQMIRRLLAEQFGEETAAAVRIQYGGSVKPENAADLLAAPDIDGALVGGASLKAEAFTAIVRAAL